MPSTQIRKFRLEKNLTQHAVASKIGISQSQFSKYESGSQIPSANILNRLAKVLDVEVFEFFYSSNGEIKAAFSRWEQNITE